MVCVVGSSPLSFIFFFCLSFVLVFAGFSVPIERFGFNLGSSLLGWVGWAVKPSCWKPEEWDRSIGGQQQSDGEKSSSSSKKRDLLYQVSKKKTFSI